MAPREAICCRVDPRQSQIGQHHFTTFYFYIYTQNKNRFSLKLANLTNKSYHMYIKLKRMNALCIMYIMRLSIILTLFVVSLVVFQIFNTECEATVRN